MFKQQKQQEQSSEWTIINDTLSLWIINNCYNEIKYGKEIKKLRNKFKFLQYNSWMPYILIHIYIIGHYNPSVRIIDLVSHTTYVVCVKFIREWRGLQFKFDTEQQIFWETFHGNFYFTSEFLPEICWEEVAVV